MADYYENAAFLEADGSEATKKASAKTDGRVVYFRSQQKKAYNQYVVMRDVKDTLKRRIETISRVGGFKVDADDAEAQSAPAKPKGRRTRSRSK